MCIFCYIIYEKLLIFAAFMKTLKIAILDLYEGAANQGMRCIREIVNNFAEQSSLDISWDEFEVRKEEHLPDLTYDIYISSGGPGSPIESVNTSWEQKYFSWIKLVVDYNAQEANARKKNVFFICHSFQLACRYFNLATVCKRKSTAFGIFPMHLTADGLEDIVFTDIKNPIYAVDSRDYQVIAPNFENIQAQGAKILAIEKERPHVPLERAIMGFRFNADMVGTQFHPEADAIGMSMYFQQEEKKKAIIENHGEEKWQSMVTQLNDPDKIMWTYNHILPNFLNTCIANFSLA